MGDTATEAPAAPEAAPEPTPGTPTEGQPAPETPAAPPPETPPAAETKPDEPSTRDWATFHRKAKEVRQREASLKAREADVKAFEDLKAKAKDNPLAIAEVFGPDVYERMTMALIGQKEPGPEDKIAQLEKWKADFEQKQRDDVKAAEDKQRASLVASAKDAAYVVAKAAPTKFRNLCRLPEGIAKEMIWAKAQEMAPAADGDLADDAVLAEVEKELVAFKTLLADEAAEAAATGAPAKGPGANGSKTLTSRGVSGMASQADATMTLPLSPDERDKEILKRFQLYRS